MLKLAEEQNWGIGDRLGSDSLLLLTVSPYYHFYNFGEIIEWYSRRDGSSSTKITEKSGDALQIK